MIHHPAFGGPEHGIFVIVLRLAVVDIVFVKSEMPLLSVDGRHIVKRFRGVLPSPPLAENVIRV